VIERARKLRDLERLFRHARVVAILGARQVGKTTLAVEYSGKRRGPATRFDLEDPAAVARLAEPMRALRDLAGLVILDEIHHRPDLFPVLRVLADRPRPATRFLVLGSASPALLRQTSESLAGRIAYLELEGFSMARRTSSASGCEAASRVRTWRARRRRAPPGGETSSERISNATFRTSV
jgi:predicted AAA+ superfamily ATPase